MHDKDKFTIILQAEIKHGNPNCIIKFKLVLYRNVQIPLISRAYSLEKICLGCAGYLFSTNGLSSFTYVASAVPHPSWHTVPH